MLTLVANTTGELMFLRPDQWFLPTGARMDIVVTTAIAAGRSSRVIYPARVIETNPESVGARARAGELIRVLPEVPTRMAVFGSEAAVLPRSGGPPGAPACSSGSPRWCRRASPTSTSSGATR